MTTEAAEKESPALRLSRRFSEMTCESREETEKADAAVHKEEVSSQGGLWTSHRTALGAHWPG